MFDPLTVAIAAFVFTAVSVGGWRAIDLLERHKADREAARRTRAIVRRGTHYTGPRYSNRGRETGE